MNSKYKELGKNVFLFTISGFIPKILSFILVPLYTSYLSTYDYGISDLIVTTVQLLIPIFTLDIQDAVMRYSLDKNYDNKNVLSYAIHVICKGAGILLVLIAIVSFFEIEALNNEYLVFLFINYVIGSLYNTFSLFCRGINKVKVLTIGSVINSAITLSSNILLLAVFKMGLTGFLISSILGTVVAVIYIVLKGKLYQYISFKKVPESVGKEMKRFSYPLIFSVTAWWVNNASDRYILTGLAGVAVSGIYAVAYKIPSILTMFQNIFTQAWSISAIKEFDKKDSDGFIGETYTLMNFGMIFSCSVLMILNIPIAKLLYANEFFYAWKFVPPLLLSVVFNAMALFIGSIFTAVKDTKTLSYSTIIGATVNIIFNFLLIPYFGAYGAAVATALGYGVVLIMRHIILRKYIHMKINMKRDIMGYIALLLQIMIAFKGLNYVYFQILVLCIIIVLYIDMFKILKNKMF